MKRVQRAQLLSAIVILVLICGTLGYGLFLGQTNKVPTGNYYPLAVGDQWTYKLTPGTLLYTETIPESTTVGDETAYAVVIDDDYSYMGKVGRSIYQFGQGEPGNPKNLATFDPPQLTYPQPFTIGQTWETSVPSEAMVKNSTKVFVSGSVEKLETIKVPAGVFKDCVKILVDDPRDAPSEQTEIWFAKNVGIVKTITYTVIGNRPATTSTTELVKSKILPGSV